MKRTLAAARLASLDALPLGPVVQGPPVTQSLHLLQAVLTDADGLCIDLPSAARPQVRRLIHRGTQRPVFRVPSLTLERSVHCESLLEVDAAVLLDADPVVTSFAEQPIKLWYAWGDEWRAHVPDFAVAAGNRRTLVEVKFHRQVDADVLDRTRHLTMRLAPLGWEYHLVTERQLRFDSRVANALAVRQRARLPIDPADLLGTLDRLRARGQATLGEFGWSSATRVHGACLAHLMLLGHAQIDWRRPLGDASVVLAADAASYQEGGSWLLAPSK